MTALLWAYQYLLKRIPTEEFSVLPVVMAVMVFAPLFFSFFTGGISRYVVEAYAKGDFESVTRIISSIVPPLVVGALAFLAIGLGFALNVEDVLNVAPQMVDDARAMMAMLVLSFAGQMLALPWVTGFHVRQRFVELNLLGVARDLLRIGLLIAFLLVIGPQVVWVIVATVIADGLHSWATYFRGRQMVPEIRFRLSAFEARRARILLNFGVWTTLGRLGSLMYTNAATIVLNIVGSPVDVTSYYIGTTFFRQIESLIGMAALPLQPVLTTLHAMNERFRLANTVLRGGRYALWVSLSCAVPMMIYADSFVTLYLGSEFQQAMIVILMFMVIFPFTAPTQLLSMTAIAVGQVREFFIPAFLAQLIGLILMLVSVRLMEEDAIAVTISLALVTIGSQLLYFWTMCLRVTGIRLAEFARRLLVPGYGPALTAAVAWFTLDEVIRPESWLTLTICVICGGSIYLTTLYLLFLEVNERRDLNSALNKLRRALT